MNSDSRVVRGVSIAAIVLSALGILGGLVIALFMGIASTSLNDPAVVNALVSELESSSTSSAFDGSSSYSSYDYSGMTQDETMAVASASIFLMVGLSLGYVLCKVVCLVAGIIALRNCNNPAKLGSAFGWSIAAAIVSFLVGGMISMVLFIVSAVFVSRVRRAYAAAPMGAYGYQQPQQYQQGVSGSAATCESAGASATAAADARSGSGCASSSSSPAASSCTPGPGRLAASCSK